MWNCYIDLSYRKSCWINTFSFYNCSKGAIEEAASLVRLKTPIEFGSVYNDPVRYVIGMSIKSAESINQAIYDMMKIFGDENNMNKFDSLPDEQAVLDMVNSFQIKKYR